MPSDVAKAGDLYEKLELEKVLPEGEMVHVVVGEVYTPYHFWVIPQGHHTPHALDVLMDGM